MNKKKLFGALASAAMLLNGAPLNVFAEEMVETGPSGTLTGVDSSNVALSSTNFPDDNLLTAIKNQNPTATTADGVEKLVIQGNGVKSLEGLQYLTELKSFALIGNDNISTLDLSNNTALTGGKGSVILPDANYPVDPLYIVNNGALTSITLPEDEDLKALTIINNPGLDEINLAPCDLLEDVDLSSNSLDNLNLSGNVYIQNLDVANNDLYQLDATPCKQLNVLNAANNKIYELKVPTAIPNALNELWVQNNKLQTFDGSGLKGLTALNLSHNMLNSIVLPNSNLNILDLGYNHLAALNLKKISFGANAQVNLEPQYLYANATDKAVNIKDYDANFNPDQAKLPNDKDFNDNGVFDIPEVPGEASKAQFTNENTTVEVTPNGDGTYTITVYLNGVEVNPANYKLDPASFDGKEPGEIEGTKIIVTGQNNYIGEAVVPVTVTSGVKPPVGATQITTQNTTVTYRVVDNSQEETVMLEDATGTKDLLPANTTVYYTKTNAGNSITVIEVNGQKITLSAALKDKVSLTVEGTTALLKVSDDVGQTTNLDSFNALLIGDAAAYKMLSDQANVTPVENKVLDATMFKVTYVDNSGTNQAISLEFNPTPSDESGWQSVTPLPAGISFSEDGKTATIANAQSITLPNGYVVNPLLATLTDVPAVKEDQKVFTSQSLRIVAAMTPVASGGSLSSSNVDNAVLQVNIGTDSAPEWKTIDLTTVTGFGSVASNTITTPLTASNLPSLVVVSGKLQKDTTLGVVDTLGKAYLAGLGFDMSKITAYTGNSATNGTPIEGVPIVTQTTLGQNTTRVVYKMNGDTPTFLKVQVENADGDWEDLDAPVADFKFGTFTAPTNTSKAKVVIESTTNENYYIASGGIPVLAVTDDTAQDEATPLNKDNTQVVYTKAADGTLTPTAVQVRDGDTWKDLATGDAIDKTFALSDLDETAKTVTVALATGAQAPEGYSLDAPITGVPAVISGDVAQEEDVVLVSMTVDGTLVDEADLSSFEITDPVTADGNTTVTLSYAQDASEEVKNKYFISGGSISGITATLAEQEQMATLEYAPANNLSKAYYIYSTNAQNAPTSADSMTVYVLKEDLMNRLYNPNSGEHFYTKDTHEKDVLVSLGWQYEGIGWVAPTAAQYSQIPVYRLYNPNAGDHHYTKDPNEKDTLVRAGWSYEGIGWYSAADRTYGTDNAQPGNPYGLSSIEVFREYNPNAKAAGAHNYTINEVENSVLTSIGWLDEGIAWWALK